MKKILLVKTSSLGDVVHNFPAVSDVARRFPGACIDWVVEEAYAPLVASHGAVRRAIPVAVRRWRRKVMGSGTWREVAEWRRVVGAERYDAIIDTQGLLKSALLAAAGNGRRHGFDASSARERLATRFYDVVHHVARGQHAVARNRELVAAALGYRIDDSADYGLAGAASAPAGDGPAVLLHSTSRSDKLWPEENWIALGRLLEGRGFEVLLPWGSEAEKLRSERIGRGLQRANVPPALELKQLFGILRNARAVAGVDTGLVHLAAALGKPVAAIYCATDPKLTGTYGARRSINVGMPGRPPTPEEVLAALDRCGAM